MRFFILLMGIVFSNASLASEGLIIASGFGAADLNTVPLEQQANMMAKRAAVVDAQRNLTEQIKGLRLTGGTTMEDFEVSSDIVATRVKGLLKGAFELESKTTKDGNAILVEVKMAICTDNSHDLCKHKPTLLDMMATKENP